MLTFGQFINERSELDQNPVKTKQFDNKKYKISDGTQIQRFRLSINPALVTVLEEILRGNKYVFEKESNSFFVDAKFGDTGNKIHDLIIAELTNLFANSDKRLIQYVGSTTMEDFIDSDMNVNIDMIR
jgi:hypothetical protein